MIPILRFVPRMSRGEQENCGLSPWNPDEANGGACSRGGLVAFFERLPFIYGYHNLGTLASQVWRVVQQFAHGG
jgi:hypothetical protein